MKMAVVIRCGLLVVLLGTLMPRSSAQEEVRIPKSRLEELERKERELQQLQGGAVSPPPEVRVPAGSPVLAAPQPEAGALSLPGGGGSPAPGPPVEKTDVVEAVELSAAYRADAAAADRRFRKRNFTVRGEIVGFEKPAFRRHYRVLLQSGDKTVKVICQLSPPPDAQTVFTTEHGSQLVSLKGESRVPMLSVGEVVLIPGECQGRTDGVIWMLGAGYRKAR
jgi:hypothetical protein